MLIIQATYHANDANNANSLVCHPANNVNSLVSHPPNSANTISASRNKPELPNPTH